MPLPAPSQTSTALVTGASSGIGDQFARQLAARGHHVTLVARSTDKLEALAAELGGPEKATVAPADLADVDARTALLAGLDRDVEILVNNAGFGVYEPFAESSLQRELEQVRVLIEAVVHLSHELLPSMVTRRRGAIITTSSASAFQPLPFNAGYAAAKAHVLFLSEALHAEVGDHGVTATAVCPGPVATGFQDASDASAIGRFPKAVWVTAERVAADGIAAAEAGKRVVVPGNAFVKAALGSNRYVPTAITNPVSKKLMGRS
jgi:short-subunit dehydrogenase